jgi:hypothetical protein
MAGLRARMSGLKLSGWLLQQVAGGVMLLCLEGPLLDCYDVSSPGCGSTLGVASSTSVMMCLEVR